MIFQNKKNNIVAAAMLVVLVVSSLAFGSTNRRDAVSIDSILNSKKPLHERMANLKKTDATLYSHLVKVAFDQKRPMTKRWRALTTMGAIGGEKSLPELERAVQDQDWFMRDGALKLMGKISKQKSIQWSRKLLHDPSLIVRTTAVQSLKAQGDRSSRETLWEKLYAKENFRGTQSLWVRRHIVDALASIAVPGDEVRFAKVLGDEDVSLHEPAIRGLETLTGNHLGLQTDSLKTKRALWKNWAQSKTTN